MPGLVGRGRIDPKLTGDAGDFGHLFCVALRHPAFIKIEVIFETHPYVPSDEKRLRADRELGAACNTNRKFKVTNHSFRVVRKKH